MFFYKVIFIIIPPPSCVLGYDTHFPPPLLCTKCHQSLLPDLPIINGKFPNIKVTGFSAVEQFMSHEMDRKYSSGRLH